MARRRWRDRLPVRHLRASRAQRRWARPRRRDRACSLGRSRTRSPA